jgi:hypothetical protein
MKSSNAERAKAHGVSGRRQGEADNDPSWDRLTQREKFIRMAREVGADETGEQFERAFSRAFPPRKPGEPVPSYVEQPDTKGSRRKAKANEC